METWQAKQLLKVMDKGRTKPMQIDCIRLAEDGGPTPIGHKGDFVVKAVGNPEVRTESLFCEAFGNELARHFEIQTARPVLVNIDPGFAEGFKLMAAAHGINLQPGIGLGAAFLRGLAPYQPDTEISLPSEVEESARIFFFDMLVQNPDRQAGHNPNCAYHQNTLLAFDFEMCFSYLFDILPNPKPWCVSETDAKTHLFYKGLRKKVIKWTGFRDRLLLLSDSKLAQMTQGLPSPWLTQASRVIQRIAVVRDHADEFVVSLSRSLA